MLPRGDVSRKVTWWVKLRRHAGFRPANSLTLAEWYIVGFLKLSYWRVSSWRNSAATRPNETVAAASNKNAYWTSVLDSSRTIFKRQALRGWATRERYNLSCRTGLHYSSFGIPSSPQKGVRPLCFYSSLRQLAEECDSCFLPLL